MERYRKQQNKELNRLDKRTRKKLAQHQTKKRHKDIKHKLSLNYPDLYLQNSICECKYRDSYNYHENRCKFKETVLYNKNPYFKGKKTIRMVLHNDDLFIEICKYLVVSDIVNMCLVDKTINSIIKDYLGLIITNLSLVIPINLHFKVLYRIFYEGKPNYNNYYNRYYNFRTIFNKLRVDTRFDLKSCKIYLKGINRIEYNLTLPCLKEHVQEHKHCYRNKLAQRCYCDNYKFYLYYGEYKGYNDFSDYLDLYDPNNKNYRIFSHHGHHGYGCCECDSDPYDFDYDYGYDYDS